jgi:hypothetical protein
MYISEIIKLARMNEFYNTSESMEIFKGKYREPKTIKQARTQAKRKWRRRKSL